MILANLGRIAPRECEGAFWSQGYRHCEEQSDEAIHLSVMPMHGLLRFARNDEEVPTGKIF